MKKTLMYLALIFILSIISIFLYTNYTFNKSINADTDIKVKIPKGTSISAIAEILCNEGIYDNKKLLEWYLKYQSFMDKKFLKAGVYLFPADLSISQIADGIFSGKYLYIAKVTFPEGISYKQFASILQSKALVDSVSFVSLATSDSLLKSRDIKANSIEGYLLPETYQFYIESSAREVIDKLLDYSKNIYERIISITPNKSNLNKHEILTLASIVEAETPTEEERPRVAGLYLNRLRKNMLLQADPTVAYALNGKKRLLYSDLKVDSPYNTYKYLGLPPSPINNPSASSIKAVINPESNNFIYMVSKGDGSLQHNFSDNLNSHNKFVREYRAKVNSQNN